MSEAPGKPLIDPTITLGAAIQITVLVVGFAGFLFDGRSGVSQAQRDVADLKTVMAAQNVSTREAIKDSLGRVETTVGSVVQQLSVLPAITERQRVLEEALKRVEDRDLQVSKYLEERRTSLDQRFQQLEQRAIESIADRRELRGALDQVLRASQLNLPGSRGIPR
jgi:hypothetical protein